ncbi:YcaO-like family protein [Actinorhabdospora filicis]|uniref:YcaO-like family protein n=1 Tax=Actinorhabdospora filicis TaxID=1785913 RepID=UPI0025534C46|nr:YcaO-like family protein [Actinorhabdospora filicis]
MDLLGPEIPATVAAPYFRSLIDPAVGVVRRVRQRDDWPHDEPKTIMYRAELMPTTAFSSGGYKSIPAEAGRSTTHETAAASALFEAVERYCLSIYRIDDLTVADYDELRTAGVAALDPASLNAPDGADTADRLRSTRLAWTTARSLLHGANRMVPAQLVHLPYQFPEGEPVLRDPLTTGCAAGTATGPAVLRGLLEVIERDATMIRHYRGISPQRLEPAIFGSGELDGLVRACERYRLDVELFDYSLDIPVPVIAARVRDRSGATPAMTFGSKAAFDAAEAAVGALLEAVTFRGPIRARSKTARRVALGLLPEPGRVASGSERAFLWIQPEMANSLHYLDHAELGTALPSAHRPTPSPEDVAALVRRVGEEGGDILICDVTTQDIADMGAVAVKVLVPGLQPMHLSEPDRRWTRRLLTYGRLDREPVSAAELNPLPHPFL